MKNAKSNGGRNESNKLSRAEKTRRTVFFFRVDVQYRQ